RCFGPRKSSFPGGPLSGLFALCLAGIGGHSFIVPFSDPIRSKPMASDPSGQTGAGPAGLTLRARDAGDWREIYVLSQLPRVRWGTLRMPFANPEQTRKWLETQQDGHVAIVAVLDQRIVGCADATQFKGRRSHVGGIGMMVHDDFHGRGI